jgi:hypothetical protein
MVEPTIQKKTHTSKKIKKQRKYGMPVHECTSSLLAVLSFPLTQSKPS